MPEPTLPRSPGAWRRLLRHRPAAVGLVVLATVAVAAGLVSALGPYGYAEVDLSRRSLPPTLEGGHLFGTDRLGRDYLTRVLLGARTSLQVALAVSLLSTLIGTAVGLLAGWYRGWLDELLMRAVDLLLSVPFLAILLVAAAWAGHGSPLRIALILSLLLWTTVARVVRAQCRSLREREFVEAALVAGAGAPRVLLRHILPNTLGPITVNAALVVAVAILLESTLSYLGFGIQPPHPALGKLVAEGQGAMLTDWWLVTLPGLVVVAICLSVNFIGEGLRDAFDPVTPERRSS